MIAQCFEGTPFCRHLRTADALMPHNAAAASTPPRAMIIVFASINANLMEFVSRFKQNNSRAFLADM